MLQMRLLFTTAALMVCVLRKTSIGEAFQPEFAGPIVNLSVAVGRDATFRCLVHHLGGYRVGWVKADTKAIQAIHEHVITHNPRVSVSHGGHAAWNLHIRDVQEEDRGYYMCQVNTDPMKSQVGHLDVVVPPDFVSEETSGDVMVPEGGTVRLTCRARGHPMPHVQWRREDGQDVVIREPGGHRVKSPTYQGEILKLVKITRSEMGAYMCIASNGVPPTISKRIMVSVHFHPVIQVPNQLVGAPPGTDVCLECYVEAFPVPINYWVRDTGDMVITDSKHEVRVSARSMFEVRMALWVRNLDPQDAGTYRCVAKNSVGEVESSIRLYIHPVIQVPNQLVGAPPGTDVCLECYVEAFPVPINYWVRDTGDMVITDSKHEVRVSARSMFEVRMALWVRNLDPQDAGTYRCVAKNSVGEVESSIRLYIHPVIQVPNQLVGAPPGTDVCLECYVEAFPVPINYWVRDTGDMVITDSKHEVRVSARSMFEVRMALWVRNLDPQDAGTYRCVAKNSVGEVESSIRLYSQFHPVIQVPNQLVGAPPGTDVCLECYVEAFPVPINYWVRDTGDMVITDSKHEVRVSARSMFEVRMALWVRNLDPQDAGTYRCVAKNSVGEVESSIRLYMIPGPTKPPPEDDHINSILPDHAHNHSKHHGHGHHSSHLEGPAMGPTSTHTGHRGNRVPTDLPAPQDPGDVDEDLDSGAEEWVGTWGLVWTLVIFVVVG